MELSKKTTILFSVEQHRQLQAVARRRGVSLGSLVRAACQQQYGGRSGEERLQAARALGRLALPVGSPAQMKRESVPAPKVAPS